MTHQFPNDSDVLPVLQKMGRATWPWEGVAELRRMAKGLAGGLALSTLAGCVWFRFLPETPFCCTTGAALFGFCVGGTGVMGDLFESMLKRDSGIKDASSLLPGFGGCLDVLDSLLVAGPIAWLFFS